MCSRSYAQDQRRRRRACRPHVERCEERALLSSGLGEFTAPGPQDTITLKSAAASYTLTTLVSFNGANGAFPAAAPVLDAQGNLFGTTQEGGANGQGTVFELPAGSRTLTTLTTLASFNDANGPNAQGGKNISLVDAQGNLFGTTNVNVPIANNGTVFELAAGSGTITTLAPFTLAYGSGPNGGLVRDAQGNLFGTTFGGGPSGNGTVFELAAGSGTITTFANFNGANGTEPVFGLVRDLRGNFYGLTNGGISGMGTVFELTAGSDTITTRASFNGANGLHPSSLLLDPQGNIFGTTTGGGANGQGTVFELPAGSGTITTLASFNGASNLYPFSLVRDAQGNLFGTTTGGGANGQGTVFELPAGSGTITTLVSFNGANGTGPAFLALDAQGNLFGTTFGGGAFDQGTVFELSTTTTVVSLQRFGFHHRPTSLVLTFSEPMDASRAEALGNYTLVALSHGHSRVIPLKAARYNGAAQTVTLFPRPLLSLHRVYQITVNGMAPLGLTNTSGVLLDGQGNGQPGTNFMAQIDRSVAVLPPVQHGKALFRHLLSNQH